MRRILFILVLVFAAVIVNAQTAWDGTAAIWTNGSGTEEDPFQIENGNNLAYLAQTINDGTSTYEGVYFIVTEDIDLGGTIDGEIFWTPIGSSKTKCFKGVFDGKDHTINNMFFAPDKYKLALFYYNYGEIRNLGIESNCVIIGKGDLAGLVVYNESLIENCYNLADITATTNNVGGIATFNGYDNQVIKKPVIVNCYNKGNLKANGTMGGIVGTTYSKKSEILNCYNNGTIQAISSFAGGIIGTSSFIVRNCYNTASVKGVANIGGIAGTSVNDKDSMIENSYNVGSIEGKGNINNVGGVIGGKQAMTSIINSYSLENVVTMLVTDSDPVVSNGNEIGEFKQAADMKTDEFVLTLNAQQFPQVWFIDMSEVNDNYPVLVPTMFEVTVNIVGEGSLEITNNGAVIENGESLIGGTTAYIKAEPAEGYRLISVKVNGVELTGDNIVVNQAITIDVEFREIEPEAIRYTVSIATPENGTIVVKNGPITIKDGDLVEEGSVLSITTTPNANYILKNIMIDGEIVDDPTVEVSKDITISAVFELVKYKIEWTDTDGGVIVVKDGESNVTNGQEVTHGTELTISFDLEVGYTLTSLKVNGVDFKSGDKYNVVAAVNIGATTAINEYVVSWVNPKGATIVVKDGSTNVKNGAEISHGTVLKIEVTPSTGYTLGDIIVNDTPLSGNQYTVIGETSITAVAIINKYEVSIEPTENGTLTVKNGGVQIQSGASVEHGATLTITANPDKDYELDYITINGDPISGNEVRVTKNLAIGAVFKDLVGVNSIENIECKIYSVDRTVYIESNIDTDVNIYDISGRIVKVAHATNGLSKIDIDKPGMYIVKTSMTSEKLIIK